MSAPIDEPLSWLAIQHIKGLIATITTAAGYRTNIGSSRLLDDRSQIDAEEGAYVLIIARDFEQLGESGSRTQASVNEDMGVLIEFGIARDPAMSPELAAHRARADIQRALRTPLRGQVKGLRHIAIQASAVGDAPDGAALIVAQVQARAGLSDTTPPAI